MCATFLHSKTIFEFFGASDFLPLHSDFTASLGYMHYIIRKSFLLCTSVVISTWKDNPLEMKC